MGTSWLLPDGEGSGGMWILDGQYLVMVSIADIHWIATHMLDIVH